jgi:hypothetical protein
MCCTRHSPRHKGLLQSGQDRWAYQHNIWLKEVNDEANEAANFINDSGNAKCLLQRFQVEMYGRKLAVDVSVPTRFVTNLFVMVGIQRSKAALVQAVSSQEWLNLGGKADKVRSI